MRRELPGALKAEMKANLLAGCQRRTGYDRVDPNKGCSQGGPNTLPRACECLAVYSCMQRHGDFGFDPDLFRYNIEDIIVDDRGHLDRYLADPARVWREGLGCYVWGDEIGIGKTTMVHQIVRRLYRHLFATKEHPFSRYRAWYLLAGDLADRAHWKGRDGFLDEWITDEGDAYDVDIFGVDLLVVDELGREARDERRSAAGREMLEQMLRERRGRVTILAGHDPPDMIERRYGEHVASLMSRTAIVHVSSQNGDRRRAVGSKF